MDGKYSRSNNRFGRDIERIGVGAWKDSLRGRDAGKRAGRRAERVLERAGSEIIRNILGFERNFGGSNGSCSP